MTEDRTPYTLVAQEMARLQAHIAALKETLQETLQGIILDAEDTESLAHLQLRRIISRARAVLDATEADS